MSDKESFFIATSSVTYTPFHLPSITYSVLVSPYFIVVDVA